MLTSFARFGYLVVLAVVTAVSSPPALVAHHAARPKSGSVGYDVGDFSCGTTLPKGGAFGIVGVTAGRPFHRSPCLADDYVWAKTLSDRPQFYLNLADPGHKSPHWGKGGPKRCRRTPKYDLGCAYDYGVKTAAAALRYAKSVGSAGTGRWWLDVEPDNTWGTTRAGIAANIADIQGALHYLRSKPHTSAGIYTETVWWLAIADDIRMAHTAVWGGGANSKQHARENCRRHSITGGPALVTQWITGSIDHDLAC